jgi:cell division protease FtsH
MGGRAAEEMIFGDITNGASQDIKQATEISRLMVCNWGMSDELGMQKFGQNQELMFLGREVQRTQDYSEATAKQIDEEVSQLLENAYERAMSILTEQRDKLNMIAEMLLEQETLDGRDVEEIVEHGRVLSAEERAEIDRKSEDGSRKSETSESELGEMPEAVRNLIEDMPLVPPAEEEEGAVEASDSDEALPSGDGA